MKRKQIVSLALVGMANGVLMNASLAAGETPLKDKEDAVAFFSEHSIKNYYAGGGCGSKCSSIAASCKGPNGCSSEVAERDTADDKLENPAAKDEYDPNDENLGYHLMSEQELLIELNGEGTKLYQSLSPEGKALAREVASQRCAKTNSCRGLNACETASNECAGKGSCKGQTKCGFSDKNLAVKVVADKMKAKRLNMTK